MGIGGEEEKNGKELIINSSNQCLEKFGEKTKRGIYLKMCV